MESSNKQELFQEKNNKNSAGQQKQTFNHTAENGHSIFEDGCYANYLGNVNTTDISLDWKFPWVFGSCSLLFLFS
jgi:hypothetical protein